METILPLLLELLGKLQEASQQMAEAELEKLQSFALVAQMHLLCFIAKINSAGVTASNNIIYSIQSLGLLITEAAINTQSAITPDIPEHWKLTYVLSQAASSHPAVAFALSWIGPEFPGFVATIVAIRLFFRR